MRQLGSLAVVQGRPAVSYKLLRCVPQVHVRRPKADRLSSYRANPREKSHCQAFRFVPVDSQHEDLWARDSLRWY